MVKLNYLYLMQRYKKNARLQKRMLSFFKEKKEDDESAITGK